MKTFLLREKCGELVTEFVCCSRERAMELAAEYKLTTPGDGRYFVEWQPFSLKNQTNKESVTYKK